MKSIFNDPKHPYTKGLIESIPSFDSTTGVARDRLPTIEGMVPSLFELPEGCSFQDRCAFSQEKCRGREGSPVLEPVKDGLKVSCFFPLQ